MLSKTITCQCLAVHQSYGEQRLFVVVVCVIIIIILNINVVVVAIPLGIALFCEDAVEDIVSVDMIRVRSLLLLVLLFYSCTTVVADITYFRRNRILF